MIRLALTALLGFSISLLVAETVFAAVPPCTQASEPHSFSCQQEAFRGTVFPLAPATPRRLQGNWRTLVYVPSPGQPKLFQQRVSATNPRIPVGVLNGDGTAVGSLFWPNGTQIQHVQFGARGRNYRQVGGVSMFDANTAQVTVAAPGVAARELFLCRIFIRNRNDHLLCQWFHEANGKFNFKGYFGYVR